MQVMCFRLQPACSGVPIHRWFGVLAAGLFPCIDSAIVSVTDTCPGRVELKSHGSYSNAEIVATMWNTPGDPAANVDVVQGKILPHLKGRAYFADDCQPGIFSNANYLPLDLRGKIMRYTVDLSSAGCGCNVALYMTALHQNAVETECKDYYCDANTVCGTACAEIDIQEANTFAWLSTLHAADDPNGKGAGYGGGGPGWSGPRDWDSSQYGPHGSCIDTTIPFQVAASFPVNEQMVLASMTVTLSQNGFCTLTATIDSYDGKAGVGKNMGMLALSEAFATGMTPIVSYWESEDMGWLDGKGEDGKGPCEAELNVPCGDTVAFYDFSFEDIPPSPWTTRNILLVAGCIILCVAIGIGAAIYVCRQRQTVPRQMVSPLRGSGVE